MNEFSVEHARIMECQIEYSRPKQRASQLQRIRPRHACKDMLLVRFLLSVKILISCSRERLTAAPKSDRRTTAVRMSVTTYRNQHLAMLKVVAGHTLQCKQIVVSLPVDKLRAACAPRIRVA